MIESTPGRSSVAVFSALAAFRAAVFVWLDACPAQIRNAWLILQKNIRSSLSGVSSQAVDEAALGAIDESAWAAVSLDCQYISGDVFVVVVKPSHDTVPTTGATGDRPLYVPQSYPKVLPITVKSPCWSIR